MKQANNKMFRRCPYETKNFENCSFCPNYYRCIKKKRERIKRRIKKKLQVFLPKLITILLFALCILTIIAAIVSINSEVQDNPNNKPKQTTEQTESNKQEFSQHEQENVEFAETTDPETPKAELSALGESDEYYYHISDEDKVTIAKVVWAESRGECFEGKVAVAAVVLNRYYSGISYFHTESILAVATQPYQFASIENVTISNLENNPDCMRAVEAACKGWDPTRAMFSSGALYFYAPKYVSGYQAEIREGIRVLVIGNHNFHYDFEKVK